MRTIEYSFEMHDGSTSLFFLEFEDEAFTLVKPVRDQWPKWTELGRSKCAHCPLSSGEHPRCPLAESIVDVIEKTDAIVSHERLVVKVKQGIRTITVEAPASDAIRSLMGLIIPTSGCPHTAHFRPMARFHLPFSDPDETLYRSASMYMLAKYMRTSKGLPVEEGLRGLDKIYADVNLVNFHMAQRLRTVCEKDSSLNAITLLDVFAQIIPMQLDDALDELLPTFGVYTDSK